MRNRTHIEIVDESTGKTIELENRNGFGYQQAFELLHAAEVLEEAQDIGKAKERLKDGRLRWCHSFDAPKWGIVLKEDGSVKAGKARDHHGGPMPLAEFAECCSRYRKHERSA